MLPWSALFERFRNPARVCLAQRHDPPDWRRTLLLGCLPLIVLGVVVQILLLQVFPPPQPAQGVPHLPAWGVYVAGLQISAVLGLAWLGSLLAEAFDGRMDFNASLLGVSLALMPWTLARMLEPLPVLGWLALPMALYGFWVLYRVYGICLRLEGGRLGHLFACLMGTLVIMLAVGWQLRDLIPGAAPALRMGRLWII